MSIGKTSSGRTAILTAEHVCNPHVVSAAILILGGQTEQTIKVTDFYGNTSIARRIHTDAGDKWIRQETNKRGSD